MGRPLALVLVAACAGAPAEPPRQPGSRGPRASDHLEAARDQERLAEERAQWPDTRQSDSAGQVHALLHGTPWRRHWDSPSEHEQLAAAHRGAAAKLQAEYEHACGSRSLAEVSASPIARYGVGVVPADGGAIVYLAPAAGPPERLVADIECHRAWMMLAPSAMDECPFDLDGLHVDATGDAHGITLHLTITDPSLVPELQRRAERDLELHTRR